MPWWTWAGLGVFVLAVGAAGVVALLGLLALGRTSRGLQGKLQPLAQRLTAATEELDRNNARFATGQERARLSFTRLRGSVAQLQVLVAALEEIRIALRILRLVRSNL